MSSYDTLIESYLEDGQEGSSPVTVFSSQCNMGGCQMPHFFHSLAPTFTPMHDHPRSHLHETDIFSSPCVFHFQGENR